MAVANGHTAVEKELRKFLKVRSILGSATVVKPCTLEYGESVFCSGLKKSIENHRFSFEIGYRFQGKHRTPPPNACYRQVFKCPHALLFYHNFFILAVYIYHL